MTIAKRLSVAFGLAAMTVAAVVLLPLNFGAIAPVPGALVDKGGQVYNVKAYGLVGDGAADNTTAITAAKAGAGVAGGTLLFPPGTYRLASGITFPANVPCRFEGGAKLSIDSGVTVTFNGTVEAPQSQIFAGAGQVVISGRNESIYPLWWGADSTGVADSAAAIQAALDARSHGEVYLGVGKFKIGTTLVMRSRVRLRGASGQPFGDGIWQTQLTAAPGFTGDLMRGDQVDVAGVPWTHGMILEDLAFVGVGANGATPTGSGIRATLGEESEIHNCSFQGFPEGGVRLQHGQAPARIHNITCYNNKWDLWLDQCNGTVTVDGLSADDSKNVLYARAVSADPNVEGQRLNIDIRGLKLEASAVGPYGTSAHNPAFLLENPNECQLVVNGGEITAVGNTDAVRNVVGIEPHPSAPNGYSASVTLKGVTVNSYHNLVKDNVLGATVPWVTNDFPRFRKIATVAYRTLNDFGSEYGDPKTAFTLRGVNPVLRRLHTTTGGYADDIVGTGSPEGVVTAGVGARFTRLDGGPGTTEYYKESGAGNTGWVARIVSSPYATLYGTRLSTLGLGSGARDKNLTTSVDLTAWQLVAGTAVAAGQADPLGGTGAYRVATTTYTRQVLTNANGGAALTGATFTYSLWAKGAAGTTVAMELSDNITGAATGTSTKTLSGAWEYLTFTYTFPAAAGTSVCPGLRFASGNVDVYWPTVALASSPIPALPPSRDMSAWVGPYEVVGPNHNVRAWVNNAAPSSGTWAVGDEAVNYAPTAGGTDRWRCTTAGTPGTWKAVAVAP